MNNIVIWEFEEAPEFYKKKSKMGEPGDWLAFVPNEVYEKYKDRISTFDNLFKAAIEEFTVPPGVIYIISDPKH
jgi:hypothetical protein